MKSIQTLGLFVIAFNLVTRAVQAQSGSTTISFQGILNGTNHQQLPDGQYSLEFAFYEVPSGGRAIGSSNVPSVSVTSGLASALIPVDPNWFNGSNRYLAISLNGQELSPRVPVSAVPYALAFSGNQLRVSGFEPGIQLQDSGDPYAAPNTFWKFDSAGWNFEGSFSLVRAVNGAIGGPTIYSDKDSKTVAITPDPPVSGETLSLADSNFTATKFQVFGHGHADIRLMDYDAAGGGWWTLDPNAGNTGYFRILRWNDASTYYPGITIDRYGSVEIGQSTRPVDFVVHGTNRVSVLQITGGADLAEHLTIAKPDPGAEFCPEPGMVVSIDPKGSRRFKLSDEPYDRKRVGIISGGNGVKPGLILRDEGNPQADGDQPIALTGQVWCRADASFGAIVPGDLLTTSSTPGHAMKVTDESKARFAVLGQALTCLNEGRGWVQVLVGKQ